MSPTEPLSAARFRDGLRALAARTPFSFPADVVPGHFRRAAVLIPFWPDDGDIHVALIRRARTLRVNPGQVAFAGGMVDPGESWIDAALREAHEEMGLDTRSVAFAGRLDDAWSGFGHHIAPVAAWLEGPPRLRANPDEVDEILVASLSDILRPEARSVEDLSFAGLDYTNVTLRWRGGEVDRLYADLLLEAVAWGLGERPSPGRTRLQSMLEKHEALARAHRALDRGGGDGAA